MKEIKIFVVDDSAIVRQAIAELVQNEFHFTLLGIASNPIIAMEKFKRFGFPDVLILDIEMPQMNGLDFLKILMAENPLPVIICSTVAGQGSKNAIEALSLGAVDIIQKPEIGVKSFFKEYQQTFIHTVINASHSKISKQKSKHEFIIEEKKDADAVLGLVKKSNIKTTTIIGFGSSTGGVQTIEKILTPITSTNIPPIVIVQHMPPGFTKSFASRLNMLCHLNIKEAEDGDKLLNGRVLIAPGDKHLTVKRISNSYVVKLKDGPKVSRHKPSVDILFRSLANEAGDNAIGIILTGMGSDGALGLKEMLERGAKTYVQDKESCVVFGMPKEALNIGAASKTLTLEQITDLIKHK
ncbi:protein-glutamate methylesterase/protein-glutamine glutaminase [Arcobacter sp.]|uniref:protein-glutamate methylesterase/protein-glutamine glutaminase n=1 Tax=Arcobacter sp. TaxID=1872629 RepID=UPI003D0D0846